MVRNVPYDEGIGKPVEPGNLARLAMWIMGWLTQNEDEMKVRSLAAMSLRGVRVLLLKDEDDVAISPGL